MVQKNSLRKMMSLPLILLLLKTNRPTLGVIYAPALNVLYFSEEKFGSYKLELKTSTLSSLDSIELLNCHVSINKQYYGVVTSRSHLDENTLDYIDNLKVNNLKVVSVPMGSSLKFCLLAEGLADCYPRFSPCMEWDTAAGQIICEEAGFKVVDLKTMKPIIYNRENLINNYFIAKK